MRKPEASLERIFKGLANGRRLQILRLLKVRGSLSLEQVARHCGVQAPPRANMLANFGWLDWSIENACATPSGLN